jgi:hypothetical protein
MPHLLHMPPVEVQGFVDKVMQETALVAYTYLIGNLSDIMSLLKYVLLASLPVASAPGKT